MNELLSSRPGEPFDLTGQTVVSSLQLGVHYLLRGVLGEGGMGAVYDALRVSPLGTSLVAFKILHPEVVFSTGNEAALSVRKEAVALGRINEQSPPTPYVVRLLDTGLISTAFRGRSCELPWLALERVHGGAEGSTLHERVLRSCQESGHAFPIERALSVIDCVGAGLEAVHREGVVHRDLKPANVLCSGQGAGEVFKISDFGIARPSGVDATFGAVLLGTPGYVAPEQCFPEHGPTGPWSDVFSFAALVFFALTGESYFQARALPHAMMLANGTERRRLADASRLVPELATARTTCDAVDRLLAQATVGEPLRRPASAFAVARALSATLRSAARGSASRSLPPSTTAPPAVPRMEWNQLRQPDATRRVRRAAWDGDGHSLALTSSGLEFWDGAHWLRCDSLLERHRVALGVVQALGPGRWLLAGAGGCALTYEAGQLQLLPQTEAQLVFTAAAGDPFDLAVFVGHMPGAAPRLHAIAGGRWMRPFEVPGAAAIADVVRISDTRWLTCGALEDGRGFACWFEPLQWALGPVLTTTRPLVACTASTTQHGLAVGLGGCAVRAVEGYLVDASASCDVDFWSAAIDASGAAWSGAAGQLYFQRAAGKPWEPAYSDERTRALPFTSLFADVGRVVAMTHDGALLEGRAIASG